MVHKDNFIVCVKSDGKILREKDNKVILPFGSEYTILLKNLDSRKSVVSIDIDGKDVIGGNRIIVNGNDSVELKGKMKNSNVKNRFKFIKKTEEIIDRRGDRIDDGIIRVEVTFEEVIHKETVKAYYDWTWPVYYKSQSEFQCDSTPDITWMDTTWTNSNIVSSCSVNQSNINNDEGITVKGSKVKQKFDHGYTKSLESQSTVFTIRLCGTDEQKIVKKPVFTTDKFYCPTCGKSYKSNKNYCSRCGTKL